MKPTPAVSIIIATSSRTAALSETLRSLAATRVPDGWSVELLVVENVVRAGAEELLGGFPAGRVKAVRYFFEPARGKSRALNLALQHASGAVLLFTDDDVRFPADWIGPMCAPIIAGRADAVAGGVRLAPHLLRPWMNHTHRAFLASTADYLAPDEPSEMCGANMAVSRRVFDKVGGFDVELGPGVTGGGEESLLSWRLKQAGFGLAGALDVEVEHYPAPERLHYESWKRAARLQGLTRAYVMHHWLHRRMPFPRLTRFWHRLKLVLRRLLTSKRKPGDEGIPPWELSYLESIAMATHYLSQRVRPKQYARGNSRIADPHHRDRAEASAPHGSSSTT